MTNEEKYIVFSEQEWEREIKFLQQVSDALHNLTEKLHEASTVFESVHKLQEEMHRNEKLLGKILAKTIKEVQHDE